MTPLHKIVRLIPNFKILDLDRFLTSLNLLGDPGQAPNLCYPNEFLTGLGLLRFVSA